MYNAEIKRRFLDVFVASDSRKKAAETMFNALEPYENEWGADICTKSKEEAQPVVSELIGLRAQSKKLRLPILRKYVKWCIDNGVEGACDGVLQINELDLDKFKTQTVANPTHLQRYLDCICDKESEETVDCIYRCYYWLAYGGVDEKDVLSVTVSDVDLIEMTVNFRGKKYPIYREAIHAFKNGVELTRFRFKHPNYSSVIYKDRADGDILLRGISELKSIKAIRVEMSRKAKNSKYKTTTTDASLDLKISFYRVWLSGLFYRTYESERAGIPPDFTEAAQRFMDGKTYKLDKGRNLPEAKQRQLARDYLKDYIRWKEAYSI